MNLYRLLREPQGMRTPALVVAFDAWVDAGGAASAAAAHLAREAETIATFDTDELLDYRTRRPILDVVEGEATHLAWQELTVKLVPAVGRDLLVLTGPEPDHRWKQFSSSIVELARRLGVTQSVALGAVPAAVPHTRPVPLLATSSPRDLLGPEDRRPEGLLRVPAAALSAVQMAFADDGVPTVGFFAQVPHYVVPIYSAAVVALLERLARHLGVEIPLDSLREEAQQQHLQLDALVAARPDIRQHVERLESMTLEAGGPLSAERIPSADEIAAEVEKFLQSGGHEENR